MEKARQSAVAGATTLLLCYNRLLAEVLQASCSDIPNLTACSYHQLCHRLAREAKVQTGRDLLQEARQQLPNRGPSAEFDLVLPLALALATEALSDRYDSIIIDEGQDFRDEYWLGIEWLLRSARESELYVFYDQNQALYTRCASMPINDPPFVLTVNCRNTRHIHEAAYRFFRGDPTDPPENEGGPVDTIAAATISEQSRKLQTRVVQLLDEQGLGPSQVAVLICGEPKDSFVGLLKSPLPRGVKWLVEGPAGGTGVRVDTVKRFKGLEADVVFLWGLDVVALGERREVLYVGTSRAKSRLILVGSEAACHQVRQFAI